MKLRRKVLTLEQYVSYWRWSHILEFTSGKLYPSVSVPGETHTISRAKTEALYCYASVEDFGNYHHC